MFNNATVINGPEYFYDTTPDITHQGNVKGKLPVGVLDDVDKFLVTKKGDKNIYRSQLNPFGWIIFTDEIINHSSPTIDSRAISGDLEKGLLISKLENFVVKSKLDEVGKYFAEFDKDQKFYPEDIMKVVGNPDLDKKIAEIFVVELKKANMSIVQINNCDPERRETGMPIVDTGRISCTKDLNPHPSKVSPDNVVLKRENSDPSLLAKVPKSVGPRQFIRLWVQVAPKQ
jgi:hypothetical protein